MGKEEEQSHLDDRKLPAAVTPEKKSSPNREIECSVKPTQQEKRTNTIKECKSSSNNNDSSNNKEEEHLH